MNEMENQFRVTPARKAWLLLGTAASAFLCYCLFAMFWYGLQDVLLWLDSSPKAPPMMVLFFASIAAVIKVMVDD